MPSIEQIIAPAVQQAGLDPVRADEERIGGTIHKPMFERLMMCPYAVADITGANPNVYYELGIRHALRPRATVVLFSARHGAAVRCRDAARHSLSHRRQGRAGRSGRARRDDRRDLRAARDNPHDDSPMFQLIENMPRIEVDHSKTDLFRERAAYSKQYKERLATARARTAPHAVKAVPPIPRSAISSKSRSASSSTCFCRCAR